MRLMISYTPPFLIQFEYVNRKRPGSNIKNLSKFNSENKAIPLPGMLANKTVMWPKNKEHHSFQDLWCPHRRDQFWSYLDVAQGEVLKA